jgi:hypothetical protein
MISTYGSPIPITKEIFYGNKIASSGGILDVDANANCSLTTRRPVENIYWPLSAAPSGMYTIHVHHYRQCEEPSLTQYQVRLKLDGEISEFSGVLSSKMTPISVVTFTR